MRKLLSLISVVFLFSVPSLSAASAQGTPEPTGLAESDVLWGGNYVDQLPSCESDGLCLAVLTQRGADIRPEFYHGVIQNNTKDWVDVNDVTVTLFDDAGEFAALGDTWEISPRVISPGGHAFIGITVSGEYISEFTTEAQFDYEAGTGGEDGWGVPLRVNNAEVRGTAVLGEVTNISVHTFSTLYVRVTCFAENGKILYSKHTGVDNGPYGNEASARFAIDIFDNNCANFAVSAFGSPY
jgi:hypothetical protein